MKSIFATLLLFFFFGCHSKRVFENYVTFSDRCWKIEQPTPFKFQITDTTKTYNLFLNVRNSLDYPFSRLFVNSNLTHDSTSLSKKMILCYLFDQKTGSPFGASGIGDIYDHQFPIVTNYTFKKSGDYTMTLAQVMRLDTLSGILAVGFRVETVQAKK